MITETAVCAMQIQGIVKERNEYKRLLDECLSVFNAVPSQPFIDHHQTYKLKAKIDKAFRRFNN